MAYFYSASAAGFFVDDAPMPSDVLPVTDEQHAALMAAQATGARIKPADDGTPAAVMPTEAETAAATAAAARAARDRLLNASDPRTAPDYPQTEAQRGAWLVYRAALRAWPSLPGWPDLPLPTPPG